MSALRSSRVALALVLALAAVAAVAVVPAAAAPPPEALCGVCGGEFEDAAAEAGVPLTVEHSALNVTVRDDGSGHWDARATVGPDAAERLAANETLRDEIVRESLGSGRTVPGTPENLTTGVDNDTLLVAFDVPGVAERRVGGVLLVTLLHRNSKNALVTLDADRVAIHGPDGARVTSGVGGMETADGAVVWERSADGDGTSLPRDTLLAFAPGDGVVGSGATWLAKFSFVAGRAGPGLLGLLITPLLALGVAVASLAGTGSRPATADADRFARGLVLAGVGVLALAAVTAVAGVGGATPALGGVGALYLLLAGVAVVDDSSSPWPLVGAAAVGLVALAAAGSLADAPGTAALAAPVALFLPLGYVDLRGRRARGLLVAALLAVPALLAVGLLGLFSAGLSSLVVGVAVIWAFAAGLFGLPLFALGNRAAARGASADRLQ